MNAVGAGKITPSDAAEISKVVAFAVKAFEAASFADRAAFCTKRNRAKNP
jgi:hypothetical protein